jgi:hypothetical protein
MDESITRYGLLKQAGIGAIGGTAALGVGPSQALGGSSSQGDASFLYVSPAGNDANDGKSWSTAKRQISSAVSSAGGSEGIIWVASGSYAPFSLIGPNNRVSVIGLGDVTVVPRNNEIGILIDNSAGTPLVGPLVENILVAGDGAKKSTIGIRLKNALRGTIRRCRIANCLVGVDLYNDASGFTERNAIENTLINNCGTGIRYYRTPTGASSFSYNNFINVGIDFCPTGIDIGSVSPAVPHPYTNSYVNVVVWGQSDNDVLVKIAGDILGSVLQLNLERLSGANVVGYDVRSNAAHTLEATLFTKFVGSFENKVRLAAGKELRWIEGRNTYVASSSAPSYERYFREGDTHPRTAISDGRIEFGDGAGPFDVGLSRSAANVLALDAGDGLQFAETRGDLAAAATNAARLYARDNGSGKTQLVVRFHTGAVVVIATEP